jgi:BirA family transcriptional regulator, biotin operon repressor / biotin---[acetyl-CoA-carboxylase] ligase
MELLSHPSIARALAGIELVRRIEYRPTVSSTNDLAKQLGAEGAPEVTVVIADEQTAGRGRLERAWWSPPGAAVAMSLLVRPSFPPTLAYRLTMLTGLAAVQATEEITGLPVRLKWPNDVVVAKPPAGVLKLGGILTETAISGDSIEFAVVGMGLNVNVDFASRPDLPEATSLMVEMGRPVNRLALVRALVERFANGYVKMAQDEWLYAEWSARLVTLGRQVAVHRGQEMMTGLAEGVDTSGALLVRADDGRLHRVDAADVTLRDAGPNAGAISRTDHERYT